MARCPRSLLAEMRLILSTGTFMTFHSRSNLAALAVSCFAACSTLAQAADSLTGEQFEQRYGDQAVSAINFKVEGGYIATEFGKAGEFESAKGKFVQGSLSVPIGSQIGLQIDAGAMHSEVDGLPGFEDFGIDGQGIGGHLFWRDPGIGLLGVYGQHTRYDFSNEPADRVDSTRLGVEGEAYLDNFTLKGFVGRDTLDWNSAKDEEHFLAAHGEIDFYLNDDFMVFAGVEHAFEETSALAGFEAMFDTGGVSSSVFAEASLGADHQSITAGLRVYFGPKAKSLKARHREDDPASDLFANLSPIGKCMNKALHVELPDFTPEKVSGIFPVGSILKIKKIKKIMKDGHNPDLDGCSSKKPTISLK